MKTTPDAFDVEQLRAMAWQVKNSIIMRDRTIRDLAEETGMTTDDIQGIYERFTLST